MRTLQLGLRGKNNHPLMLLHCDQLDNQGWKTYMTLTKIFKTHQKDHSSIKFDINIEMIY